MGKFEIYITGHIDDIDGAVYGFIGKIKTEFRGRISSWKIEGTNKTELINKLKNYL